jgi:membrane fusion protein, multidrug efflux system
MIGAVMAAAIALLALPKLLPDRAGDAVKAKQQGQQSGQKINVSAIIVQVKPLSENIGVPGSVLANEQVELKAEAPGRIVKLALKEGAEAQKGDLLVKINDADLQAQLEKATASFRLAQDRGNRQKTLLAKELISKEDYDVAVKELAACQADIDLIRAQIDKTEIRAPFDGRVGLKSVSEGAYVSTGDRIADFVSVRPIKIEFSIPERYAGKVGVGSKISFFVQGLQERFSATVFACQPGIDEATRSLRMRAVCREAAASLYPGAFANVSISLGSNPEAIAVPTESIVPDIKGQKVYCVKSGKAVAQTVVTGVRTGTSVEIISGLTPGDTVVTSGVLMLRPGMAVDIKKTGQ